MKIYFLGGLILSCLFFVTTVLSQDLTGTWEGYLDQSEEASKIDGYKVYWENGYWKKGAKTHVLKLSFNYDEKKNIYTGEYFINETLHEAHYAKFAIKATMNNNKVRYNTTSKIFETQNTLNTSFCYSEATLNYSEDVGYEYLEGNWRGWNDKSRDCASAHVKVRRKKDGYVEPEPRMIKKPDSVVALNVDTSTSKSSESIKETVKIEDDNNFKDRKMVTKETMHVPKDSILIQIWDSNRVDGDIISLDFNGRTILSDYTLTSIPKSIKVRLLNGNNFLTLLAHNLGDIPPNTAALSIEREEGHKVVILKSDMGQSESVKIIKE